MKFTLTGEESLRIEPTPGLLSIEAPSHNQSYSALHIEISVDAVGAESPATEAAL
jgi:hypothetical protein